MSVEIASSTGYELERALERALDLAKEVQDDLQDSLEDFEIDEDASDEDASAIDDLLWAFRDLETDVEDALTRVREVLEGFENLSA